MLTLDLNAPWFGHHDTNGVWISSAVRNFELYGAANLGFLQVTNPGPNAIAAPSIYNHHPPLVTWLSALSAALFGFHEASVRLVFIWATMISLAAFYVLVRRLYGVNAAFWAVAIYIFTPAIAYFGRVPGHEALSLAVSLLYAAVLVKWLKNAQPPRRDFLVLGILASLAVLSAWSACFYIVMLNFGGFIIGQRLHKRTLVGIGCIALLTLIALLAFYEYEAPGTLAELRNIYFIRTSSSLENIGQDAFTLTEFISKLLAHLTILVTPAFIILGLIGIRPAYKSTDHVGKMLLLGLFAACIGYILVFRNAAFIHDYYIIFTVPALITTGSALLKDQRNIFQRRKWVGIAISALLVSGFINAIFMIKILHDTKNRPHLELGENYIYPAQTINVLIEHTQVTDLVASNISQPDENPAVEYYAFRNITWNVSPEAALTIAVDENRTVIYMYCVLSGEAPEMLQSFAAVITETGCLFITIEPPSN